MGRFLEHFLKMDLACSIFFNIKSKTWKVESTWSILFPCLPLQLFFLCRNIVLKMATQSLKKQKDSSFRYVGPCCTSIFLEEIRK